MKLEVFVKVQNILEARLENVFLIEKYLRQQMSSTTTTRAHNWNETMRVRIKFLFMLLDQG